MLLSPLKRNVSFYLTNLNPFTQRLFGLSLVKIGQVILEKIQKCIQCIPADRYYVLLEKGMTLHLNKCESPSPKDAYVPSLVEICPVVLEKIFIFL